MEGNHLHQEDNEDEGVVVGEGGAVGEGLVEDEDPFLDPSNEDVVDDAENLSAVGNLFKDEKYSEIFSEWCKRKDEIGSSSGGQFAQQLADGDSYFDLNYDATMHIFSFLDLTSLCRVSCVSKSCRDLADSNEYWLPLFRTKKRICLVKEKLASTDQTEIDWKLMFSKSQSFDTIDAALKMCAAGQTVFVTAQSEPYKKIFGLQLETDHISLIGVTDASGQRPVLSVEGQRLDNVVTIRGKEILLKNFEIVQPGEQNIVSIYCTGTARAIVDNCVLKSKGLSGLFVGDDSSNQASVDLVNSEICNCKGRATVVLKAELHIKNSRIHNCYNAVYLADSGGLHIEGSEFYHLMGSAVYMSENTSAVLHDSKISDCSSCVFLVRKAEAKISKCDFSDFRWSSAEVHEDSVLEMVDTVVHESTHENSNGVYSLDSSFTARRCTFTRISLSGIQTMGGQTKVIDSKISDLLTGISSYTRGSIHIEKNVIERCKTGVRIGAKTELNLVKNEIRLNRDHGVHITRLRKDQDIAAEQLRRANTIHTNGDDVQINVMVLEEQELGGVSPEVYLAVQEKICTFQYTGSNYHPQKVYRCNTCKLVENRGMCFVCMERCHAGHEVEPDDQLIREFFCDCGAEKFCDLLGDKKRQKTNEK